jgi:hypothetical protein
VLVIAAGEGGGGRVGTIVLLVLVLEGNSEVVFLEDAVMFVKVVKLNGSLLEEPELKGAAVLLKGAAVLLKGAAVLLKGAAVLLNGVPKAAAEPLKLLPKGSLL